jgi:heme/copper-type cytochrome/quinol oxidase subunit 1
VSLLRTEILPSQLTSSAATAYSYSFKMCITTATWAKYLKTRNPKNELQRLPPTTWMVSCTTDPAMIAYFTKLVSFLHKMFTTLNH